MKTFRNEITKLHITNLENLNQWEFVSFYQQNNSKVLAEYENRDGVDNKKPNVSITASGSVTGISTAISLMEQMEMDSE